jgi:hypothetical protein
VTALDEDAFAAYVINNAPRYSIEILERILKGLSDNIASRRWGKPRELEIGSKVAATMFDAAFTEYGEVVSMTPKGCTIEAPGLGHQSRISFKRYAVRILDEFEWNRVSMALEERHEQYERKHRRDVEVRAKDREAAVADREHARRYTLASLSRPLQLYRGAYVHAFEPDSGLHEYGVVVHVTPKSIVLSNSESDWESRVWLGKTRIRLLDDRQWAIVDAEQRRRRKEYEDASKAGKERGLLDYSFVEIQLDE